MLIFGLRRLGARGVRVGASFALLVVTGGVSAQQPRMRLSLDQALEFARKNNPDFQAQKNDVVVAEASVREAYGRLLPSATLSSSLSYQAPGTPRFGVLSGSDFGLSGLPSYYSSDYMLGLNYSLSGANLVAPRREKSGREAVEATIRAGEFQLMAQVTRQYLAVLRATDAVVLAQEELERAAENLKLAQARVAVGATIPLEAKQAEVERGRAEVALLQARSLVQTEKLRLMQQLGTEFEHDLELTTEFSVFDLPAAQADLVRIALEANPQLQSARASEHASEAAVKMARSAYLPTIDLSAGLSGFTRQAGNSSFAVDRARQQVAAQRAECERMNLISAGLNRPLPGFPQNCAAIALSAADEQAIRNSNEVFPFEFRRQPWNAQLRFSLPLFQGFSRERQVDQARAATADARHRVRAEELRLKTEVAAAYLNATTARQSVQLESRNRELADDQLTLARERYRVGVATYVELQEAETIKARADRAYLIALYSFHEAVAALEAAVGRNLRPVGETR